MEARGDTAAGGKSGDVRKNNKSDAKTEGI